MTVLHLPQANNAAVDQRRITEYLLNPAHEEGASKAKFFLQRGFTTLLWQEFSDALRAQGKTNPVTRVTEDTWGTRYRVDCTLLTPDGLNPCIRTVWMIDKDAQFPRLLTAHPF